MLAPSAADRPPQCPRPRPPAASIYVFMASIAALLAVYAWLLVPETNQVPIERLQETFASHWLWRRFFPEGDEESPEGRIIPSAGSELDAKVCLGGRRRGRGGCAPPARRLEGCSDRKRPCASPLRPAPPKAVADQSS